MPSSLCSCGRPVVHYCRSKAVATADFERAAKDAETFQPTAHPEVLSSHAKRGKEMLEQAHSALAMAQGSFAHLTDTELVYVRWFSLLASTTPVVVDATIGRDLLVSFVIRRPTSDPGERHDATCQLRVNARQSESTWMCTHFCPERHY